MQMHYLRGWFASDLIGALPFDYFVFAATGQYLMGVQVRYIPNSLHSHSIKPESSRNRVCRFCRLLQATHLIRFVKLLRLFRLLRISTLYRFLGR